MKNRQEIEHAADRALNSLDGIQQAEANEFLFTRIINRMQHNRQEMMLKNRRLMLRLSLCLALFSCINALSFYFLNRGQVSPQKQTAASSSAFAKAYGLNNSNAYSY